MLYAIAGDGAGNATEIKATLADLREKATKDEDEFWFLLMGKDEPTKTEAGIVKWLVEQDIWFEVIGDESEAYEGAQKFHSAKNAEQMLLKLLAANKDDGAMILALFVDTEADVDEDAVLYAMIEEAIEAGVEVRLLNGQMVRLQLGAEEAEDESETTTVEGDEEAEAEEGEEEPEPEGVFTEAELKKMTVPELQAVARGQGITLPKGGGKGVLIAALLEGPEKEEKGVAPAAAVKVTGAATNGAMVIVVVNGSVHIRPVSEDEALALV